MDSKLGDIILGIVIISLVQGLFFQLDAHAMKQQTVIATIAFSFSWWVILIRIFLPPLIWVALNLLNRAGGTWFTLLALTFLARLIQVVTFGVRYGEWPDTRGWAGIILALLATIITIKI